MCMSVCLNVCVHHVCALYPQKPEECVKFPGRGAQIIASCCVDPAHHLGPLQEQEVLLAAEPFYFLNYF